MQCVPVYVGTVQENAVLDLVWCYKRRGDSEQDLWRYWLPERCIKQWCDKPTADVASARSVGWGSNEALTLLYLIPWPSALICSNTSFRYILDSHHWLDCPFTADNCVLPLLFLRSVSIMSGCPVINIRSCHQDMKLSWAGPMAYQPHTGFHYSKLLIRLSYYGSFHNITGMDLCGSGYRRMSNLYPVVSVNVLS